MVKLEVGKLYEAANPEKCKANGFAHRIRIKEKNGLFFIGHDGTKYLENGILTTCHGRDYDLVHEVCEKQLQRKKLV